MPVAKIISKSINNNFLNLKFEVSDSKYHLRSYNIYVNDVVILATPLSMNLLYQSATEQPSALSTRMVPRWYLAVKLGQKTGCEGGGDAGKLILL